MLANWQNTYIIRIHVLVFASIVKTLIDNSIEYILWGFETQIVQLNDLIRLYEKMQVAKPVDGGQDWANVTIVAPNDEPDAGDSETAKVLTGLERR